MFTISFLSSLEEGNMALRTNNSSFHDCVALKLVETGQVSDSFTLNSLFPMKLYDNSV